MPLQLLRPPPQLTVHAPPLQTSPARHPRPHIPQFARSVFRSRHVPLQLLKPLVQLTVHALPLQT
jgi:hypothetical protein